MPYSNQPNLTEMVYRLKARLALANFKRQHGYEKYDLYTLESSLLIKQKKATNKKSITKRHRYYPTKQRSQIIPKQQQMLYPRYPLSEKRSTSPLQHYRTVRTDEDAANVLVMLHNMS